MADGGKSADGEQHSDSGLLASYKSKQFGIWMLVSVTAFVAVAMVLEMFSTPPVIAFTSGAVFMVVTDPLINWLKEWKEAENEVETLA